METLKQRVIAAVWDNPAPAFGGEWKPGRNTWEYLRGEIGPKGCARLLLSRDGESIKVFYNHGSGRAGAVSDVFDAYADNTGLAGFVEALRALAELYKIPCELTEQERETITRRELAGAVTCSLSEHLRAHPDGPAGVYLRETRHFDLEAFPSLYPYFGQLTAESLDAARRTLKQRGKTYAAADWEALGLTEQRARAGYNVALPYYRNGIVAGFVFRSVNAETPGPKYLFSAGLERGAYCARLDANTPAAIVEGELDALRLMQQGVKNVIAIGGAKPGPEIAKLMKGRAIVEATYIPDNESDETGRRKTGIVADAIAALYGLEVEGRPVLSRVLVADLPGVPGGKVDADTYGAEHPGALPGLLELSPVEGWRWEADRLREQAAAIEGDTGRAPVSMVCAAIVKLYGHISDVFARERFRQYVGASDDWARYGVTPDALANLDAMQAGRDYFDRIKAGAADLTKAVQEHADAGTVAGIIRRLSDAQAGNTRAEWDAQLSEPFDDELDAIRKQPDALRTRWELGNIDRAGQWKKYENIEFFPADITLFCAATSHGKTAVLFNAALDVIRDNPGKTCLFVSVEENKRQLLQRALKAYLPIETTETGRDASGRACFKTGTRKRALLAALRDADTCDGYAAELVGVSELFRVLKKEILLGVEAYRREIRPRLKFVHTEADAESICTNIRHTVEAAREQGEQLAAVFVDYMQLLTAPARGFSRPDELKEICKALHDCAGEIELPIIAAAQLNRAVFGPASSAGTPLDNITVANIGEGADLERIAHDVFIVWQTDRTPLQWYADGKPSADEFTLDVRKIAAGIRSRRLFTKELNPANVELKRGYLYIEQLKARDGNPGGWGLFPFDGERGTVGANDLGAMKR